MCSGPHNARGGPRNQEFELFAAGPVAYVLCSALHGGRSILHAGTCCSIIQQVSSLWPRRKLMGWILISSNGIASTIRGVITGTSRITA